MKPGQTLTLRTCTTQNSKQSRLNTKFLVHHHPIRAVAHPCTDQTQSQRSIRTTPGESRSGTRCTCSAGNSKLIAACEHRHITFSVCRLSVCRVRREGPTETLKGTGPAPRKHGSSGRHLTADGLTEVLGAIISDREEHSFCYHGRL